jgi:biotin carboxyl carrier protein
VSDDLSVQAPFPGVFYRKPDPESPEFVQVGDDVQADTVVGLIEVMKMFQEITAGVSGKVVSFEVENEGAVSAGQVLLILR